MWFRFGAVRFIEVKWKYGRKKTKDWRVFWIFGISISHFIKSIVCHQFWIEKPSHLGSEGKTFQDTYTEWLDETNNRSNMVDMPYWIYKTAFDKTEMVWGAFKDSRLSLVPLFVRYCKASILILSESYYRFRWEKSRFYEFDLLEFIYSHPMWYLPSILCLNQTFFTFDTAFVLK